jgi:uncharacterized protein YecE (DUF72 family)
LTLSNRSDTILGMPEVKVGCCGFPIGRKNYYRHFPCVEIQQTFYHPPKPETLGRWRQEAPAGFFFTVKAWQLITHTPQSPTYRRLRMEIPEGKSDRYGNFRPSGEVFRAWETTRRAAETLGARIICFQSPPSFRPTREHKAQMKKFFSQIARGDSILGWEPRGWEGKEAQQLCQDLGLLHIGDPFQARTHGGGITYWRLHGIRGYRYRYTDDDLNQLKEWMPKQGTVYVMFNNTSMFQDGLRFKGLWGEGEDGGT